MYTQTLVHILTKNINGTKMISFRLLQFSFLLLNRGFGESFKNGKREKTNKCKVVFIGSHITMNNSILLVEHIPLFTF